MRGDTLFEEGPRLLTPNAFDFVLDGELKRAVRSQNFLTLVVLETKREWEGMTVAADAGTVEEVAEIVGREVRDTDPIGRTEDGSIALVLLDANYENSARVIDRLLQRIEHSDVTAPLKISVGAACYPTHAVDAHSLHRKAVSHPIVNWSRTDSKSASRN